MKKKTCLLAFLAMPLIAGAQTIINADTSADDWDVQVAGDSTAGTSASLSQIATGGSSGGPYLQVNTTMPGGEGGSLYEMAYFTGLSYSPQSQGPITSLTFSAELNGFTYGTILEFGLYQDGVQYYLEDHNLILNPPSSRWLSEAVTVTITPNVLDTFYSESNPGATPNLVSGDPIEFGFTQNEIGDLPQSYVYGVDDFSVTVNPVPEPSIWQLAMAGGAVLLGLKCRFV